MIKPLLWLLFAALCAAFTASAVLQQTRAHCDARRRLNAQPVPFFVHVVEPKMRAQRYDPDLLAALTAAPATAPSSQPSR